MKNLKKLFLVTTLLTFSCADIVLAMDNNSDNNDDINSPLEVVVNSTQTTTLHSNSTLTTTNSSGSSSTTTNSPDNKEKKKGKRDSSFLNLSDDTTPEIFVGGFPVDNQPVIYPNPDNIFIDGFLVDEQPTFYPFEFLKQKINQNCPLPDELIKLIAKMLPTTKDISTLVRTCQQFKQLLNPIDSKFTNDGDPVLLRALFPKIAKRLNKDPEEFLNNWLEFNIIDFSDYTFKDADKFAKAFLALKPIWNQIKILNLSFCNLTQLPTEFTNLKNLTMLDLSDNNLTLKALKIIATITSLKSLNLFNCNLTQLPAEFTNLKNLTELNLSENTLDQNTLNILKKALPNTRIWL